MIKIDCIDEFRCALQNVYKVENYATKSIMLTDNQIRFTCLIFL